ncbi:hypothetical protein ACFYNO_23085 [Kitasatospora sp. NPDC006697]|uniref:hypothetical protein n=1 Tax=Kitasatospora sp. NPDC006697 TaxID=3364020 RepID=UPI00369D0483
MTDEAAEAAEAPAAPAAPEDSALLWSPEPEPLGVPVEPTGHPEVDAELAGLDRLDGVPTVEHPAVYENVQQRLNAILTALDEHARS